MTANPLPISETNPRPFSLVAAALFLFCALLWNPAVYASLGKAVYLPMFTPGALAFPALGLLFCAPEFRVMRKFMMLALGGFALLLAGQFIRHYSVWTLAQFGDGIWWLALPLLGYVYGPDCRKLLPLYVFAVGGYALLYSLGAHLRGLWTAGITGNENWTAALFVMTMIFLGWFLVDRWEQTIQAKRKMLILVLGTAAELLLFGELCRIGSKGAFLALFLTAALFFWLRSRPKIRKIMLGSALLVLLAGTVWITRNTDTVSRFIQDDGRVIFWENAAALIADHPLFGVGQGSFENEYMTYRKADYFLLKNPASRSNHPHNHLLFIAGSWGIAGVILWGILLFAPLAVMIRKYYRCETVDPLESACFLTVVYAVLHGSLDLILVTMPTGLIALLCLGMLWRNLMDPDKPAILNSHRKILLILTAVMTLLAVQIAWCGSYAAIQVRRAFRGELTADEILQTIRRCPGEYPSNYALLNYLARRNVPPEIQLAAAESMLRSYTPNYPGLHLGHGNALMRLGRYREALESYRVEAGLFPLALRPVYNMIVAARSLRDFQLAAQIEQELRDRMQVRGNDERDLRIILAGKHGAHYDLRPLEKPVE